MANDAWLSDILNRGAQDGVAAEELAAGLAQRFPSVDEHGIATDVLLTALDQAWERGWQPADVVHVARREVASSAPLVVALIGAHAQRSDAPSRAPDAWIEQLAELGALEAGDPFVVRTWHHSDGRAPAEGWRIVLQLVGLLLVRRPRRGRARGRGPAQVPPRLTDDFAESPSDGRRSAGRIVWR